MILLFSKTPQTEEILLYAQKSWYNDATEEEEVFGGTLIYSNGVTGPSNRQNTFSLKMKESTYELYDPEQLIPSGSLNREIQIRGKLIDNKVSGISNEIWPGFIEKKKF